MVDLCCFLWYYYFINNIKQIKSTKTNMKRGAGMLAIERIKPALSSDGRDDTP